LTLSSDQSAPDAIPILFVIYDNFNAGGEGNNYGGFFWVLDVDGGAQGIGRNVGRTTFHFYLAPNALNLPQWIAQAFTAQADMENDLRLQYRVIDANATINTDLDSGTICVASVQISAHPRSSLMLDATVYNPPLAMATHFAQATNDFGAGAAAINDATHAANYALATVGAVRRTLGPFDPAAGGDMNSQLYPVPWQADTLYRVRMAVRALASEADPVDAIFSAIDTATVELGMVQYTTRGRSGGAMDRAASPRLTSAEYEAYFYSQNATLSQTPNAGRLRPLGIFFNTTDLFGDGTGGDGFVVESLAVDRLLAPP
jgi:hypothetical protein